MKGLWRCASLLSIWLVLFSGMQAGRTLKNAEIRVIYFLSPGCTICQFYTLRMRELFSEYGQSGITFKGIFSSATCDADVVDDFKSKYQLPFEIACDSTLHEALHATVTPEVFVIDGNNKIVYSGRIDDAYAAIGKRRPRVKHNELKDALDAVLRGDTVELKRTQPVGCIIQK